MLESASFEHFQEVTHPRSIAWLIETHDIYLRFITNPRLCVENDPKKSRTSVLLQHSVKAAVIISASPLTTFDIIPFHCPISTVYKSDSKTSVTL